jgi:AhpD family alkylhydroperoxidase
MTTQRLAWQKVAPGAFQAMLGLEQYAAAHVDPVLYELVKLRASQINGCGFCIDMHSADAMKAGENPQRLFLLSAWREAAHLYTERERAALALTEEATRLGEHGVTDETWQAAAEQFTEEELANLITAIATINAWNRFGVSTRMTVQPRTV